MECSKLSFRKINFSMSDVLACFFVHAKIPNPIHKRTGVFILTRKPQFVHVTCLCISNECYTKKNYRNIKIVVFLERMPLKKCF